MSSVGGVAYAYVRGTDLVWSLQATLLPATSSVNDGFASSLSLYRELTSGLNLLCLLAGAPASSAAYVMIFDTRVSTWSENARLVGTAGDLFGSSVGSYEDSIVVGAPGASGSAGSVTTYIAYNASNRIGWSKQSTVRYPVICFSIFDVLALLNSLVLTFVCFVQLLADVSSGAAQFGTSVSIYGSSLVTGAPFANNDGTNIL